MTACTHAINFLLFGCADYFYFLDWMYRGNGGLHFGLARHPSIFILVDGLSLFDQNVH